MRSDLSKKTRFEVFKRDNFTCQYCGKKAPDIILHIDHIHPISKGGGNDILNLVTSCSDCNLGKSDRLLSNFTTIEKQRKQLESLSEAQTQREMLARWVAEVGSQGSMEIGVKELAKYMSNRYLVSPTYIGLGTLNSLVRKFGIMEIKECMDISAVNYLKGNPDLEEKKNFFDKIEGIARSRETAKKDPDFPKLMKLKNIANKRWGGSVNWSSLGTFRTMLNNGDNESVIIKKILSTGSQYSFERSYGNE